jgi:predicted O-linked N-acetylglucosamine transferase (SPINDLY family)
MTARNAPCPCGSGKKYKRCHGQGPVAPQSTGNAQEMLEKARHLMQEDQLEQALETARRLPDAIPKYQLLARIFLSRRRAADFRAADRVLRQWVTADPHNPEPCWRQIDLHLFQDDLSGATRALSAARRKAPGHTNSHYYSAVIRQLKGELHPAMDAYREAIRQGARLELNEKELEVEVAIEMYETAAGKYPGSPSLKEAQLIDRMEEYGLLKNALNAWQADRSVDAGKLTSEQVTRYSNARYNLGCACMADFGRLDEAMMQFHLATEINPEHETARLNAVFMLNYSDCHGPEDLWQAHCDIGAWLRDRHGKPFSAFRNDMSPEKRLRIGYLSSDFRKHSVAWFILPALESHDRERFSLHIYHNDIRVDELTHRARQCADVFRHVHALDDHRLLEMIRNDRIDILVDLNGLTRGHRIGVLAERAAPLQVSWIGYPNTTGLDSVQYRIVDNTTDPQGEADSRHSEALLRMDKVFSVYQPPADMPQVRKAPSLSGKTFTFGSFNFMPKINRSVLTAWAEILERVPGSCLLIKNMVLDFEHPSARLIEAMQNLGMDISRVDLVGRTIEPIDHFRYYHQVDVCLDTFPYNGTTTTCDSLYMGVPVVALLGTDHRSRVSASQLAAVGLNSLVAHDQSEYVDIAVALATEQKKLQNVRLNLRQRMCSSTLMDARAFSRQLETKYQDIWQNACSQKNTSRQEL